MRQSLQQNWLPLWDLFWSFFKISPVTFGGGYAMLPVIEREVMTNRGWITEEEMAEVISVSGSAPGGIGVNAAAFIGYKVMGLRGLVAAVLGMMLPTFLIVLSLGIFFGRMHHNPKIMAAMQGIQIAVVALIAYAGVKMARSAMIDKATIGVFIAGVAVLLTVGIHPILLIPIGALTGIILVKSKESLGFAVRFKKQQSIAEQQNSVSLLPKFPEYYYGDGI